LSFLVREFPQNSKPVPVCTVRTTQHAQRVQQHSAGFCFAQKVHGWPFSIGDAMRQNVEFRRNSEEFARVRFDNQSGCGTQVTSRSNCGMHRSSFVRAKRGTLLVPRLACSFAVNQGTVRAPGIARRARE